MRKYGFLYLLAGIAVAAFVIQLVGIDGLAASLLALWLTMAVHEAGHALLGLLVGFRPVLVIAWPFQVTFGKTGLQVRPATVAPGLAVSAPVDGRNLRPRALAFIAGGPLAGLLACCAAFYLLARVYGPAPVASPFWLMLLGVLGLFSGVTLVFGLVPLGRKNGLPNDGVLLSMLLRGGPAAERWCAALALQGAAIDRRPRDWDAETIAQATSLADSSAVHASACLQAYQSALDRGDEDAAARLLDQALLAAQSLPLMVRQEGLYEAAFFAARLRRDPVAARQRLDEAGWPIGLSERHTALRAEAAVLLAEGKYEDAAETATQALALADCSRAPGLAQAEREWIDGILADAKAHVDLKKVGEL